MSVDSRQKLRRTSPTGLCEEWGDWANEKGISIAGGDGASTTPGYTQAPLGSDESNRPMGMRSRIGHIHPAMEVFSG